MKNLVSLTFAILFCSILAIPSFSQVPAKSATPKPAAPAPAKNPVVPTKPPASAPPAAKPAAPSPDTLASGPYIVYAQATQVLRVVNDPKKMKNLSVVGHFAVTEGEEGGSKELEAFVFDEDNYTKFRNEKPAAKPDPAKAADAAPSKAAEAAAPAKALYSSGKKTSGDFTVAIPSPGMYYVVFSNKAATAGKKTFDLNVRLQYDKP